MGPSNEAKVGNNLIGFQDKDCVSIGISRVTLLINYGTMVNESAEKVSVNG